MRYNNPQWSKNVIFNEIHINWNEPIILVEGVFDALAIRRNAIPVLGKTINDALRLKILEKRVSHIYICFDNDALKNSISAIEELIANGVDVYYVALDEKDPGEVGFAGMKKYISDAVKIEFADLLELKLSL